MNTFNMKQWLTENRVGPYSKTGINESHEGNDTWLEAFANAVDALKIDKFIKYQIHQIPSHEVISMYGETSPERAAAEIVSKMSHSARENRSPVSERNDSYVEEVKVPEWEVQILGKYHMIDADVELMFHHEDADYVDHMMAEPGGIFIDDAKAKITDLQVEEGDEYREVNDPAYIKQIEDLINTDPKLNRQLQKEAEFWAEDLGLFEQIGVGYVMKVKKSDPHDR